MNNERFTRLLVIFAMCGITALWFDIYLDNQKDQRNTIEQAWGKY